MEYDVIGRLEEYDEDTLYIAMKQNLTLQMKELTKAKNKTSRKKESSSLKIQDYMSRVPLDVKEKLCELYKIDFKMFYYDTCDLLFVTNWSKK